MASANPDGAEGGPVVDQGGERGAEGGTEMDQGGEGGGEGAEGGAWTTVGGHAGRGRKRSNGSDGESNDNRGARSKIPRQGDNHEELGGSQGTQEGPTMGAQRYRESAQLPRGTYDDNLVIYVKGITKNLTKINPNETLRDIRKAAGDVTTITRAGESLRIVCSDEKQKQRLMETPRLGQNEVEFSEPYALSRGRR